jgi:hypothetical protein
MRTFITTAPSIIIFTCERKSKEEDAIRNTESNYGSRQQAHRVVKVSVGCPSDRRRRTLAQDVVNLVPNRRACIKSASGSLSLSREKWTLNMDGAMVRCEMHRQISSPRKTPSTEIALQDCAINEDLDRGIR